MAHDRRTFLSKALGVSLASQLPSSAVLADRWNEPAAPGHRFKIAMWIDELRDATELTLDRELEIAKEIGTEYVWFHQVPGETSIAEMTDAEVDHMGQRVAQHGLKMFMISAWTPFHNLTLVDFEVKTMQDHAGFIKDFNSLVRGMQIARRLGLRAVLSYGFAWPGEWPAGYRGWPYTPTWPMRWATRGGIIADMDMEKLVKAFSLVLEQAEKYDVDVVLGMRPFNYTSSTLNFRRLAERLGSNRIKVQWSPADNILSAEWDQATAGFTNLRPYLHGLHLKDAHVIDGPSGEFEWRPLGEGDVDYLTVLRNLRDHECEVFLAVATHFRPASGSLIEAMRINFANLKSLIARVEAERPRQAG